MLNKLFRPKWQHPDAQVRLAAVKQLDGREQATLQQIAINDEDSQVRQAAISRLDSLALLRQAHQSCRHRQDLPLIEKCWCAVLADPTLTRPDRAEHILLECRDPHWLAAIACHSLEPSHQALALAGLTDEKTLLQLLEQNAYSALWPLLVGQLRSDDALRRAQQLVQGRDKRTARLIREKREQLKISEQQSQLQQAQLQQLAERLQQLKKSDYNALYEGQLLNLQQQWQTIRHTATADTAASIEQLLADCSAILQQQQSAEQQLQTRQRQQQLLLERSQSLLQRLQQQTTTDEATQHQYRQLSDEFASLATADDAINGQIRRLLQQSAGLLDTLNRLAPLRTAIAALPAAADMNDRQREEACRLLNQALVLCNTDSLQQERQQLQQQLDTLQQRQRDSRQQQQQLASTIGTLLDQADAALSDDRLQAAEKLLAAIHSQLPQLDGSQRKALQPTIQRLNKACHDLKEWQAFATDPKRQALCQAMAQLIDSPLPAADKARRIRDLQQQWKALGHCRDQALWQQFKQLADQAYAPCRDYFGEQKKRKAFNAEQRSVICQQLETLLEALDWTHCDYPSLAALERRIQQEWQTYSPVEPAQHKPLQQRYYTAMGKLRDKLDTEREKNTRLLADIVNQAEALADSDDITAAIASYQQLQEQWKNTGISFHKKQQALWQQLREAGKRLYQQRNQRRQESEEQQQLNLQQAQQIIRDIQNANGEGDITAMKQAFNAIESLPRQALGDIRKAFSQACRQFDEAASQQQQKQYYRQLQQAGAALASGDAAAIKILPSPWPETIARLQQQAGQDDPRALCIMMEIQLEQPSPDEDAGLRMQLQMERLARQFNPHQSDSNADFSELYLRWQLLPATDDSLKARFARLVGPLIGSTPA